MFAGWPHGSTDVQHYLFRTGHDLDLRSNFQNDLLRSNYSSLDASSQDNHNAGKMYVMSLLSLKLLQKKTFFRKNGYFLNFCSLEAKPLIVDQIWWYVSEITLWELSNAFLRSTLSLLVPELCASLSENVEIGQIWPLVTSGLWWPDLWPDLKKWLKQFLHDFWRSFECRLPRGATWPMSRVTRGWGCSNTPGPARSAPSSGPARVKVALKSDHSCQNLGGYYLTSSHLIISIHTIFIRIGIVHTSSSILTLLIRMKNAWRDARSRCYHLHTNFYYLKIGTFTCVKGD